MALTPLPHPLQPSGSTRAHPARSGRSPWHLAGALVLCWPFAAGVHAQDAPPPEPPGSAVALPALGDAAAQDLSPMAERKLGDRIMRSIRRDPDVVDDPLMLEYVNTIWSSLLASAKRRGEMGTEIEATHAWEPFLVKDKSVNAFALPGGYIGVHLGLLAMTTTPDELASVMAHELSHVTQRHIARMISQQSRQGWVSLASMILGIFAASRNIAAGQAMIYGGQAVAIQGQLNFSRDMEREADRVGFGVMSDAAYEPAGMAIMFEHLQQASRLSDDGSYPYLRTHPLTTDRIGDARARVGSGNWTDQISAAGSARPLMAWHALMAARARVLTDTRSVSLQSLATLDVPRGANALQTVAAHYTASLAQQKLGDASRAAAALAQARLAAKVLPEAQQAVVDRVLRLSQAEAQLDANHPDLAALGLAQALSAPHSLATSQARPEVLLSARIALAQPASNTQRDGWLDAASRLQTHVSINPGDATAWGLLSQLWQHLDQPLRSVRADAEATAALGDLPGAIDRIQGAQKRFRQPNAADVIELSVMASRLKAWQRQQREDMKEDSGG